MTEAEWLNQNLWQLHAPSWEAKIRKVLTEKDSTEAVLADRETELFRLKGPCSNKSCSLHYAHSGPCDGRGEE